MATKKYKKGGGSLSVDHRVRLLLRKANGTVHADFSYLSDALRDPSPKVRVSAIEVVVSRNLTSYWASLRERLSDRSPVVRTLAAESIGRIEAGSGNHYEDLSALLNDPKSIVRITAIESLTMLRDSRAVPSIRTLLQDEDPLVKAYAAIGLAELGCRGCRRHISLVLGGESDDAARAGLLVALTILGEKKRIKMLVPLLMSRRYQVRCFVANWFLRLALDPEDLRMVKISVKAALEKPLGRADASTMARVSRELSRRVLEQEAAKKPYF